MNPIVIRYGYHAEVMARSQLHSLLLQRIPPRRLVPGKVLGMIQSKDNATVRCSDGTTHEGDVLIGADGGFSNVRHTLYWTLEERKKLPKQDVVPMSVDLHILSGCTKPLDPLKIPVLLDAMTEIQSVQVPDKPYAVSALFRFHQTQECKHLLYRLALTNHFDPTPLFPTNADLVHATAG